MEPLPGRAERHEAFSCREMRRSGANRDEVAPGVYRFGTRRANCYLVVDGAGAILIDAGYPRYAGRLETVQGRG